MVTFNKIIQQAQQQQKNILVIGSARSGTHALGAELAMLSGATLLGEICAVSNNPEPWMEINQLYDTNGLTIAQLVQLIPKIQLAKDISKIKEHCVTVNIRRKNKVAQFASYMYFRVLDPTGLHSWHNHTTNKTRIQPGSVEATEDQITQFMLEQIVDDYFLPDFSLCYEQLTFTQNKFRKNQFAFPLETMFSNLDEVKNQLGSWNYVPEHFDHE